MLQSGVVRRSALLLQGPVGGFFDALKRGLEEAGWRVRKVNFNGGDCLFSTGEGCEAFRGTPDDFAAWMEDLCGRDPPDVVILFGDRRPVHIAAIGVAERHRIPVWSFEEGYLRPDYVTFERGGNNARSPLRRDPAAYVGGEVPTRGAAPRMPGSFWRMAVLASAYYAALAVRCHDFPGYAHHRERSLSREAVLWSLNFARKIGGLPARGSTRRLLEPGSAPFFVFAAQVHDDLQVLHHGRGWTMTKAMRATIASFARSAPTGSRLVVKVHPLSRGHFDHRRFVAEAAAAAGCADRVLVIDDSPIGPLAQRCVGLVTVNSTSGLSALHHGRPVAVLGDTFYALPGLARKIEEAEGLDAFWTRPVPPDTALWQRFRAAMIGESLLPGSFYVPATWPALVRAAIDRVERATANLGARTWPASLPVGMSRRIGIAVSLARPLPNVLEAAQPIVGAAPKGCGGP